MDGCAYQEARNSRATLEAGCHGVLSVTFECAIGLGSEKPAAWHGCFQLPQEDAHWRAGNAAPRRRPEKGH